MDLSRFKTNAAKAAEAIVTEAEPVIAINPPALRSLETETAELSAAVRGFIGDRLEAAVKALEPSRETDAPDTVLDVAQVEGSPEALAMLGVMAGDGPVASPESIRTQTEAAKPKRTRKLKPSDGDKEGVWHSPDRPVPAEPDEAPATVPAPVLTLDNASTEQIMSELADRGYRVTLESRA